MVQLNPQTQLIPKILVSDLDGTLIPLPEHPQNVTALEKISSEAAAGKFRLIFCTGRHFLSVEDAIQEYSLPRPDWIICDVGTSIYQRTTEGYRQVEAYAHHLEDITGQRGREEVESLLEGLEGLHLQIEEHQQTFKISYECESSLTDKKVSQVSRLLHDFNMPYEVMGSIDPFQDCGLIDVLPKGVHKSYALNWLMQHNSCPADQILYAGDSGNDYAALVSGVKAVLVGNASQELAQRVKKKLTAAKLQDRLFHATQPATSGVLQGCRHFGWI